MGGILWGTQALDGRVGWGDVRACVCVFAALTLGVHLLFWCGRGCGCVWRGVCLGWGAQQ